MRDLNTRGFETEAIDWIPSEPSHIREDGVFQMGLCRGEMHSDVWKTGLILTERESRSRGAFVESCVHSVGLLPRSRAFSGKHRCQCLPDAWIKCTGDG